MQQVKTHNSILIIDMKKNGEAAVEEEDRSRSRSPKVKKKNITNRSSNGITNEGIIYISCSKVLNMKSLSLFTKCNFALF